MVHAPILLFLGLSASVVADWSSTYVGVGNFSSVPFSRSTLRSDYNFRLIDANTASQALAGNAVYWPAYYQIDIRVQPCLNSTLTGGLGFECCANTGDVNCQDETQVLAGPDLQIAYIQNAHVSNCVGTEFADDPNCGTYIEIHRAMNSTILTDAVKQTLSDVPVSTTSGGAYQTTFLSTRNLCAGPYELWWVVRTRSGPYVQLRKPFTVYAPSCF